MYEGLAKVKSWTLGITVKNPLCFVLVEGAVGMEFGFENPLP
jgi:hypothetical protein